MGVGAGLRLGHRLVQVPIYLFPNLELLSLIQHGRIEELLSEAGYRIVGSLYFQILGCPVASLIIVAAVRAKPEDPGLYQSGPLSLPSPGRRS